MTRWFRFVIAILAACISLGTGAAAYAADKLEGIPLEWKPTSPMSERAPVDLKELEGIKLQIDAFTDRREDPASIGRNTNKVPFRKVTTNEDVARFVTYQVKSLMSGLGLKVVESGGDVILKGEIRKFFAEDASRYNAEVEVQVTFTDANGRILWVVATSGSSSRFGISYKAANYYEVLSDALIGAVHELVHNPGFRKSLTEK
ncbi:MAG TPA: hypothetical protein VKD04_00445 [Burkholderiales bacterium]|nr:hypothetical protein [Burkholderiales bacterium]